MDITQVARRHYEEGFLDALTLMRAIANRAVKESRNFGDLKQKVQGECQVAIDHWMEKRGMYMIEEMDLGP